MLINLVTYIENLQLWPNQNIKARWTSTPRICSPNFPYEKWSGNFPMLVEFLSNGDGTNKI